MAQKQSIRTCIACGATSDKRALLRFVRSPQGSVDFDASSKAAGRGAYVCADAACFERACKKHLFDARLRTKLTEEDYTKLQAEFNAAMQ